LFISALLISISSIFALMVPHASATPFTCVWTGATDTHFNTAGNWSSCNSTVPQNGDTISFNMATAATYESPIDNNIVGLNVAGINITGAGSSNKSYVLSGNMLTLSGPITETQTSGQLWLGLDITLGVDITYTSGLGGTEFGPLTGHNIFDLSTHSFTLNISSYSVCPLTYMSDSLKGSGNVIMTAGNLYLAAPKDVYTGSVTVNDGDLDLVEGALGANNSVTVNGTSSVNLIGPNTNATFSSPITMNSTANPALTSFQGSVNACGGAGATRHTTTLSGALTLSKDTIFDGTNDINVTGTFTANGHTLSTKQGSGGSITTSAGTVETPAKTTTIAAGDNQTGVGEFAGNKETLILDGQRGSVGVAEGGILKGTGQADNLDVASGGTVAPGHSPGKLTVVTSLDLEAGSIYEAEIKNTTDFDQIAVTSAGGSVTVTDAILKGLIVDGFSIKANDTFKIIDNQTTSKVTGTFKDLPEGATFKISDGVFKISYIGGDGNDVVLTVVTVPTVANTGFKLLTSSPLAILAATLAITAGAYVISKRYATAKIK